ncbi:MAG: hypothetical protein JXR56_07045 [Candidatus Cloacimonetes bacterium]|nr:hypothetical protein [Candidatus Cloacimonadota bacterium]
MIVLIVTVLLLGISSLFSVTYTETELLNKKVTLDTDDANLSSVLTALSKMSGCNIVLAVEKRGDEKAGDGDQFSRITVHLKDVPIEQAVELVSKSVGLTYRVIGENTFLVGDKQKIQEEAGERSYTIYLNYVDATKIQNAFKNMPGNMVAVEGQNALLVQCNPQTFNEIIDRIKELDTEQKQIEIRVRMIEISLEDSKKYGIDWSKLNHLTTILAEDTRNAEGTGLPYSYTDETGALPHGDPTTFEVLPDEQYFERMESWEDFGHFSRQLYAFDITLDWLMENNAAKVLTDTRLTALNGEEADIHIGEIVPYVVIDNEKQVSVEKEEVGIKLKVKPTVNKDGDITTTISPEVSSIIDLVGGYVPRSKVRRVNSTVTVPSGKKIVVGGLLTSQLNQKTNKLPLLGDIPFIGKLFQHRYETLVNTDLVIEITPRIVDVNAEQKEYEIDERMGKQLIKFKDEEN